MKKVTLPKNTIFELQSACNAAKRNNLTLQFKSSLRYKRFHLLLGISIGPDSCFWEFHSLSVILGILVFLIFLSQHTYIQTYVHTQGPWPRIHKRSKRRQRFPGSPLKNEIPRNICLAQSRKLMYLHLKLSLNFVPLGLLLTPE